MNMHQYKIEEEKNVQVVVRESQDGEYNGADGWERVDRDYRLRNRKR